MRDMKSIIISNEILTPLNTACIWEDIPIQGLDISISSKSFCFCSSKVDFSEGFF